MTDPKKTITGLAAGHLVTDIYMAVIPAMLPLLILEQGLTYFMAGLLVTTYNLASSFTQPVIGWISDKKGIAINLSYCIFLAAIFIGLMGFTSNYTLLLVFAACAALGHAIYHPVALSLVSRLCTQENRGRLTAYFVVGGNIGFSVGPVLAGAVLSGFGLPGIALLVIPSVIMAPVLYRILPKDLATKPLTPSGSGTPDQANSWRPFIMLLAASTFRAWSIFAAITFLPVYLVEKGYGLATANLLVSGMLLAGVAGQIWGGGISDRYGRKEYIIGALALSLPAFYLFMMTDGIIEIAALLVFGFALWSTFSVAVAMSHEMMPSQVGLASGMMLGFAMGIGGIGAAVNGAIADHVSLEAALGTVPLPLVIAIILFTIMPYPWKYAKSILKKGS